MNKKNIGIALSSSLAVLLFTGCATTELQTQAKMTRTIFLDPVAKSQKTIFVSVKNTSGNGVNLTDDIVKGLKKKGYIVVNDPSQAKYILMANILFANNLRENNVGKGVVAGTTAGLIGGMAAGGSSGGTVQERVVGAVVGAVAGGLIAHAGEDDIYRMVVDVDVREKTNQKVSTIDSTTEGQSVVENQERAGLINDFAGKIKSKDGAGGKLIDGINEGKQQVYATNYIDKKTKVFAEAVKNGLKLKEALPILSKKVSQQIVAIF